MSASFSGIRLSGGDLNVVGLGLCINSDTLGDSIEESSFMVDSTIGSGDLGVAPVRKLSFRSAVAFGRMEGSR